ncbi:unnamed protein product [Durusdinium trenchii]|uniref:Uncharacterized protein n=1 Tax=Durusdinium trenchii TaxID=1381693 RepID=A0ABP0RJK1_9DINO
MAAADSFDLWAASLCWADEGAPQLHPQPQLVEPFLLSGDGEAICPQARTHEELNILSTQDIMDHEASFDCGECPSAPQESETGPSRPPLSPSCAGSTPVAHAVEESKVDVPVDRPSCENTARDQASVEPEGVIKRLEAAPQMDTEVAQPQGLGAACETLLYEVPDVAQPLEPQGPGTACETLLYEVPDAAQPLEPQGLGAAGETLNYEVLPPGDDTLAFQAPAQPSEDTLPYVQAFVQDSCPVHGSAGVTVSSIATPVRQGRQLRPKPCQDQAQPSRRSKSRKPKRPGCCAGDLNDEEGSWLVPVKRRNAEAASVKEKKIRLEVQLPGPRLRSLAPSQESMSKKQLTLAQAWKGQISMPNELIVEDSYVE